MRPKDPESSIIAKLSDETTSEHQNYAHVNVGKVSQIYDAHKLTVHHARGKVALITRSLSLVWIRAGVPLALQIFFPRRTVVHFFSNKLFQIVCERGVLMQTSTDESPQITVEVLIRWFVDCKNNFPLPNTFTLNPRLDGRAC